MAHSNQSCYARGLNSCSEKISREHYFSEAIYQKIAGAVDLRVEGFPWIPDGESKRLKPAALAANILCTQHNSDLALLDSEALRFFNALRYENSDASTDINGHLLERWYLKLLLGLIAAMRRKERWVPSLDLLKIAFGFQQLPSKAGLMFPIDGAHSRGTYNGVDFQPHFADPFHQIPAGIYVRVGWLMSYLGLTPGIGPEGWSVIHRPQKVAVVYWPEKTKVVAFPWLGETVMTLGAVPTDST